MLTTTSKVVVRPTIEHASSMWSRLASSTNINKLQTTQNAALRTVTMHAGHKHTAPT